MRCSTLLRIPALALGAGLVSATAAHADAPHPWQMNLQAPATPIMVQLTNFHNLLLWIISAIVLFVFALLAYACWRFREDRNPTPSRRSHNTLLEVVWTGVPVLLLLIIAIPSFKLLYFIETVPQTDMTIKAIGRQWYWSYVYPDQGNFTFDAYMVAEGDLQPGQLRLLETDNRLIVPVQTNVKVQTTASDVLHSWAMPSFGVKVDAVPGRLNELWFRVEEPGVYHGQCSEICGANHPFMPITVEAVTKEAFEAWVKDAQQKFAKVDDGQPTSVAAAATTPGTVAAPAAVATAARGAN